MKTNTTTPGATGSHNTNQLIIFLKNVGISPSAFAYFLSEYVRKHPAKKAPVLAFLLSSRLQSQAELIQHHLKH